MSTTTLARSATRPAGARPVMARPVMARPAGTGDAPSGGVPRTPVRPPRARAIIRPGGRLTTYGPVTTSCRARAPRVPSAAQVRARVGTTLSVLALLAALVVVGVSRLLAPEGPGVPESTAVVQVTPGDTLSAIAARTAPDAPRQAVVDRIVELNGLSSSAVRAGQTITVPTGAAVMR